MVRRVALLLAVMVVVLFAYRATQAQSALALPSTASLDFDNNGKADMVVWRPSEFKYYVLQGPNFNSAFTVASSSGSANTDTRLPSGDYNGDGTTDIAFYRPTTLGTAAPGGTWTFNYGPTFSSASSILWGGLTSDYPLVGDWDGDGRLDISVWRRSEAKLYVLQAGNNYSTAFTITWGRTGDIPLPGDYDGDGRIDFGVFRPSEETFYVLQGGNTFTSAFAFRFPGTNGQTFLTGDYDGDGRMDVAAYNATTTGPLAPAGRWTIIQGGTNFSTQFGVTWGGFAGDVAVPGDFDGDGKIDIAVWRPSEVTFFVLQQGAANNKYASAFAKVWGAPTDTPIGLRNPMANTAF